MCACASVKKQLSECKTSKKDLENKITELNTQLATCNNSNNSDKKAIQEKAYNDRIRMVKSLIYHYAEKVLWQNGDYFVYVYKNNGSALNKHWHQAAEKDINGELAYCWNVAFTFSNTPYIVCIYQGNNMNLTPKKGASYYNWMKVNEALAYASEIYKCNAENFAWIVFNGRLNNNYTIRFWTPYWQRADEANSNDGKKNSSMDFIMKHERDDNNKDRIIWFWEWARQIQNNKGEDTDYLTNSQWKNDGFHYETLTTKPTLNQITGFEIKKLWGGGMKNRAPGDIRTNKSGQDGYNSYGIQTRMKNTNAVQATWGSWTQIFILELTSSGRVANTKTYGGAETFCFDELKQKLTPIQLILLVIAIILFFVMIFIVIRNKCYTKYYYFGKS